jgi:catechol 2,3-dioxygenase-like lactoylglutathione lyase family enzyme
MERVTGIGGVFFRSRDPVALARWYRDHLGVDSAFEGDTVWRQDAGPTVWAPFRGDTEKFARDQGCMLNFRVASLEAMLAQFRDAGVEVEPDTVEDEVGRFGWVRDREGNRVELWQPAARATGTR